MPEWVFQVLGAVGMAGAVYGGIRADLKDIHHRLNILHDTANEAHKRIDSLLLNK